MSTKPFTAKKSRLKGRAGGSKSSVAFFSTPVLDKELTKTEDGALIRKGLIFVEGVHTDSQKREHEFDVNRIYRIVENTNSFFETGGNIPVLFDHKKSVETTAGNLEAPLEARVIQEEDLPNKRYSNLVGKLGVFCNGVALKTKKAIDTFLSGAVRTVSPGVDFINDCIRELSIVPIPAITGLSLYSKDNPDTYAAPLTLSDALGQTKGKEELEEEFYSLAQELWKVLMNIYNAPEEVLQETDPHELIEQAFVEFGDMVKDLLGLFDDEEGEEYGGYPNGGEMPEYLQRQQELMPEQRRMMAQKPAYYSHPSVVAAFTLDDMEYMDSYTAEFNMLKGAKKFFRPLKTGFKQGVQNFNSTRMLPKKSSFGIRARRGLAGMQGALGAGVKTPRLRNTAMGVGVGAGALGAGGYAFNRRRRRQY